MLEWNATKEDYETIALIADRAEPQDRMSFLMDIETCHSNGCPLKLKELSETDDINFFHDVNGIQRHINRLTGKLENCFIPRYAK